MGEFLKGGDIEVKINGKALGGITEAVVSEINDFYDVKEFLYGKTVYSASAQSYELTLTMSIADGGDFSSSDSVDEIVIVKGGKGFKYGKCRITGVSDSVSENSTLVRTVRLRSENKEDLNG